MKSKQKLRTAAEMTAVTLLGFFTGGCGNKSFTENDEPRNLSVSLELVTPSYKDIFSDCNIIKLESSPQSMLGSIDKAVCVNDSMLILDMPRSNVFLFSPEGKFLNKIGTHGNGPEDYYLCYDFDIVPSSKPRVVSLLNPMGELIDYTIAGKYVGRHKLEGKPNYYAFQWKNQDDAVIWSCVEKIESGLSVFDMRNDSIIYEDWLNDRMIDFQRLIPLFKYNNSVYFAPPLTNDVYLVGDTSINLKYSWNFSPSNITKEYLDEIRMITDSHEMNERLIKDSRNGTLKDVPFFNGETRKYYYVALETREGDDISVKSVFYNKNSNESIVFIKFSEGMSFLPIFMGNEYVLCQVPYDEVDIYNQILGTDIKCTDDENPLLAKFYFKK